MLTKKDLIERLKDVPDNALIGEIQQIHGTQYSVFWGDSDTNYNFIPDFLVGASYVPLKSNFSLNDLKK